MSGPRLQQQLAKAQATIQALQEELLETNRGLVALNLELEQRLDERGAQLRAAHEELQKRSSELLHLRHEVEKGASQMFSKAETTIRALQLELAETNRGLVALDLELEQRVDERTAELLAAQAELKKSNAELLQMNLELEKRVAERTAKLQELVNELEHFSYTITHDMRAPLRAMQGFGEILLDECGECRHTERAEFLRRIADSAGRMDKLITDALNYSKALREELDLEPINAKAVLQGIVNSYPQFQPPKADIQIADDIPMVLANEAGLTQCFSNLLGNAVKFVAPGLLPKVRIWAEVRDHQPSTNDHQLIRIWFEDNGIGIAKRYQEQIFMMFQRLSKNYEGTGIGLALVRKVVERMKGRVGVESEEGQGSRFWVELNAP